MISVLRHSAALLLVAVHLFTATWVEFAHHDGHATGSSHGPAFTSHDCGSDERHLPVEGKRVCAVCVHAFSMVATCLAAPAASHLPADRVAPADQSVQRTHSTDLHHSGKRGPPTA